MPFVETFVVRVWVPAEPRDEAPPRVLHRLVERVGGGRSRPFVGGESLLAFLREESLASGRRDRADEGLFRATREEGRWPGRSDRRRRATLCRRLDERCSVRHVASAVARP
jgi:hypothetical protein